MGFFKGITKDQVKDLLELNKDRIEIIVISDKKEKEEE
jgi:hypothetical protein